VRKMSSIVKYLERESNVAIAGAEWLLHSGIQETDENVRNYGGVSAWFDLRNATYPFFYSEITGYAINTFLFFHQVTEDAVYLKRARLAADWLMKIEQPTTGLFPTWVHGQDPARPHFEEWAFTFDHWMIIYGLANLAEVCGESSYLEKAEDVARFLLRHTVSKSGLFYPAFNFRSQKVVEPNDKWSRTAGSFLVKAVLGLQKLYQLTQNNDYRFHAAKLAKAVLHLQQENGRFVTLIDEGSTHSHAHLYTLEGLLFFGITVQDQNLIDAFIKGLSWILEEQLDHGGLYSFFKDEGFVPHERTDVLAQTLRLGVLSLQYVKHAGKLKSKLGRLRQRLLLYQINSGTQKGGFLYGQEEDGAIRYHVNAWVTMFAAQALWIYDHYVDGERKYDFSFFI